MTMNCRELPYYTPTAYRSDNIPDQPPSEERSWLKRFGKKRLPWGNPLELAPDSFMRKRGPGNLRFREKMRKEREEQKAAGTYVPAPYEHVDFHDRHDHERFRFSLWSARSQFWAYLHMFGKGWSIMFSAIYVLSACSIAATSTGDFFSTLVADVTETYVMLLPFYAAWALAALVIHKFPKLWIKPSRGPIWELNRRTGLVTVFDYKNNGEYKKNGTIGELTAPFYEFDAYIVSVPERQGSMNHVLFLAHRYRNIVIDFSPLVNLDNRWQIPCALWDFLQNYMDTSGPLPELPRYEEFRHLDPATAAYDRQIARPPRLWIDMDDVTYKQQLDHLLDNIDAIDTFHRPNMMSQHVRYVD
jgi:hypothetical protein